MNILTSVLFRLLALLHRVQYNISALPNYGVAETGSETTPISIYVQWD